MQNDGLVNAVRRLRAILNDTQKQFARRLGLGIATVVRYEHGRRPNAQVLTRLSQVAGENGLIDLAHIFRRALAEDVGAEPAERYVPIRTEEEGKMVTALLTTLRRKEFDQFSKEAARVLQPVMAVLTAEQEAKEGECP